MLLYNLASDSHVIAFALAAKQIKLYLHAMHTNCFSDVRLDVYCISVSSIKNESMLS